MMAEPTQCAFCGGKWGSRCEDGEDSKLICKQCLETVKLVLEHHDKLKTTAKIIRPRCFNKGQLEAVEVTMYLTIECIEMEKCRKPRRFPCVLSIDSHLEAEEIDGLIAAGRGDFSCPEKGNERVNCKVLWREDKGLA